ncbi:MAG: hypothetical protein OER86_05720, partial [Phycisphaerae bacterium]|nr:hypothetical protein [Phycisphaerae bacterium]
EERLSRKKRDRVPWLALKEIEAQFDLSDLHCFVSSRPPKLLLDDQTRNADLVNIGHIDYIWEYVGRVYRNWNRIYMPSHHLCHAANVFYASGFDEAYVLVSDGAGSFFRGGRGVEVETLYRCRYPDRFEVIHRTVDQWIGITTAYSIITAFLGMLPMNAGKTMGLAAYGRANPDVPDVFREINSLFPRNKTPMTEIGRIDELDFPWFGGFGKALTALSTRLGTRSLQAINQLTSLPKDSPEFRRYADIAYMGQRGSSDALLDLLRRHVDPESCNKLCFSGGHAHNCLLNYEIANAFEGIEFFPDPIANDDGLSIGAAKLVWYRNTQSREKHPLVDIYGCGL